MADDGMSMVTKRVTSFTTSGGKDLALHSLTLKDFVSAREQALEDFKRSKIKTWTGNADLIPEEQRSVWVREAFDRAELLTVEDLPEKEIEMPVYLPNGQMKRNGRNQPVMQKQKCEFTMWWMAETPAGRLFMTWLSLRKDPSQSHMSLDDADALFTDAMEDLEGAAQVVGKLSESRLAGKTDAPEATTEPKEKKKRRRRKR